jgi:hypothetical protein
MELWKSFFRGVRNGGESRKRAEYRKSKEYYQVNKVISDAHAILVNMGERSI